MGAEKSELFVNLLQSKFILNSSSDLPEVNDTIQNLNTSQSNYFTTPSIIQNIISLQSRTIAPKKDKITKYAAIKFLSKNYTLVLAKIFNSCLKIFYFSKS